MKVGTNVSTAIGSLQVPDTELLTYKFEVQKLTEEIEKLTKELKVVKKVCFNTSIDQILQPFVKIMAVEPSREYITSVMDLEIF